MPGVNGIDATRQILAANASVKVMALSMHLEKEFVLSMLEAGAAGYVLKDSAFDEVVHAIRTVASNCTYLSPQVAKSILKEFMDRFSLSEASFSEGLSPKERKVLPLMAEGKSTAKIAAFLKMEPGTIESLRNDIILQHLAPAIKQGPVRLAVSGPKPVPAVALSTREKEILLLVMNGKNSAEMAALLDVSRDTIKFHMKKMFKKMHTTTSPQTVAVALANGLI
jgi:DNA-binding NarL/FixJ family response regulator